MNLVCSLFWKYGSAANDLRTGSCVTLPFVHRSFSCSDHHSRKIFASAGCLPCLYNIILLTQKIVPCSPCGPVGGLTNPILSAILGNRVFSPGTVRNSAPFPWLKALSASSPD